MSKSSRAVFALKLLLYDSKPSGWTEDLRSDGGGNKGGLEYQTRRIRPALCSSADEGGAGWGVGFQMSGTRFLLFVCATT